MEYSSLQLAAAVTGGVGIGFLLGLVIANKRRSLKEMETEYNQESDFSADKVFGEYKMVILVRNDLKMAKGMIAAQVGHAAVRGFRQVQRNNTELLRCWERAGQTKVVVKAPDQESLLQVIREAQLLGINTHLVRDAGMTQVVPGSETVLCVGPGPSELIDQLTGHFKLY